MEANEILRQTAAAPTVYVNYFTRISGSGATAVGPGAQVNNFHPSPARGDVHVPRHNVRARPGSSRNANMEQGEQAYQDTYTYERARPGRRSFNSENNSGSYCLQNVNEQYYQHRFGPRWMPKPSKFIFSQQVTTDTMPSIESFLQDVDKSMKEFESSAGPLKEEKEQVILLQILPHLEASWSRSSSHKMDTYKILAKISSSRSSSEVAKHALQQLQYLLFRDNLDSCKESLLKVEKIVRTSIISPDAVFKDEEHSVREIRLSVYKRILSLICIHQIQAGFTTVDFRHDLKKLQEELKQYCSQISYKRKNYFRYSMEFIQEAISYLLKQSNKATATNLGDCLDKCQSLMENQESDVMQLPFPQKLKKNVKKAKAGDWFDLHCVLCYLHGKVHSERPTPQMCIERRALILLRRVVEAYQEGGGGDDWRFCLLAASILSDVVMNNMTKELRIEAGGCLINLLKDKKLQKRPECRAILERVSSEVLFSPDPVTKMLFADHLLENQSLQHPLAEDLHVQQLKTRYRNQTLEINKPTISQGQRCFVKRGIFQRKEVVVKILYVTKQEFMACDSPDQSRTRDRLVSEAYNLRRLRCLNHPHISVLLGYNTKSLPYHIITEFERNGNLLHFVQASREDDAERLPTFVLLKMLLEIIEALLLLENHGLVHRAVMAENILVGDNCVCKLSGMHSLRQLQKGSMDEGRDNDQEYDYCSSDDCCLEVICQDDGDESVRWKAPECLLENRYSTASDVWAFGVLMYELLTYGCRPYRNIPIDDDVAKHVAYNNGVLPRESCFEDDEFNIMRQSWERPRARRITLAVLKEKLDKLQKIAEESEEKPRDDPPPLELHIYYISCQSEEKADDAPARHVGQDGPLVKEKITNADKNHLKKLLNLNTPNLAKIWKIDDLDSHHPVVDLISAEAPLGNLKEYVLDRRCQIGDIVMFLSQVASALHYLHVNHIVHGDLRAKYVNVLPGDKVQVTRLGRSMSLSKRAHDITSTSCVVQRDMPADSTRWSSPEVILENNYSHASDVWAFGILAWELYTAFATGQERRDYSVPYCNLVAEEVIDHVRNVGPPARPVCCPDWVYIVMHQCWTYDPVQRPPFIAIFDCLTSRRPMDSWMMSLWLERHEKSEWPDLSINQPENACHIADKDKDRFKEIIEQMCSEGFKFPEHDYKYVPENSANRVDYELYDGLPEEEYSKSSSDLIVEEEEYEEVTPDGRPNSDYQEKTLERLGGSNSFSTEPRYQNVPNDVIKNDVGHIQEEELYDDAGTPVLRQLNDPRYRNVPTDKTQAAVEEPPGEAGVYDDVTAEEQAAGEEDNCYEEIEERSPDLRQGSSTNEQPSNEITSPLDCESYYSYSEVDMYTESQITEPEDEDVETLGEARMCDDVTAEEQVAGEEDDCYEEIEERSPDLSQGSSTNEQPSNEITSPLDCESYYSNSELDTESEISDPVDEHLYEEIDDPKASEPAGACKFTDQGNNDSGNASCEECYGDPRNGVAVVDEEDSLYEEIRGNHTADYAGYERTTGPQDQNTTKYPDKTEYTELTSREYMHLTKLHANFNSEGTSPANKDVAKLNNRRGQRKRN